MLKYKDPRRKKSKRPTTPRENRFGEVEDYSTSYIKPETISYIQPEPDSELRKSVMSNANGQMPREGTFSGGERQITEKEIR